MLFKKFVEKIKKHFQEVLEIKTNPHEIALGFSIGTFFANFPTFGLEFVFLFTLVIFFKKISKISLILAYAVWNPLITYPLIGVSYLIGNYILGTAPITTVEITLFEHFYRFTLRYLLGSTILASTLAIISYPIIYYLSVKYQKKELPLIQKPIAIEI